MITVKLKNKTGSFAENKDIARDIRLNILIPAIERGEKVVLDFQGINSATQSFVHALISDLMRKYGVDVIEKISFKSCNEVIQKIITIVIDYMQESSN
ncbi:MAG: STAS-like domain-containing protein [Candidatus Moranbacteria bacterium]|nr:STAS-like domain-containing protein [Candidatus Moranbacteria bacterium]